MVLHQALVLYPIHLLRLHEIRTANEPYLVQGNTEQDWGFGQIAAILVLGNDVALLCNGIWSTRTATCCSASSCELTDYRILSVAKTSSSKSSRAITQRVPILATDPVVTSVWPRHW